MTCQRRDIDRDDAGNEFYSPRATDYIAEHAERIGLSFQEAAELYERDPNLDRFDDGEFLETVSPETARRMNAISRDPGLLTREFHEQFKSIFGGAP